MIDWGRVTELRNEIGAEDFSEVVKIFLEEVDEEIAILRVDAPREALESKLHFLKGSALNLGFAAFARICHAGEKSASTGAFDNIDLPAILGCYDQSKAEFLAAL